MIISLDKDYNVISVGTLDDPNAFSIKTIEEQDINIAMYNYKYENGTVINLGLKREFSMTREEKIKDELEMLDNTINRATEDLYTLTETTPYESTKNVINRKIELRQQLKNINKEGEM